MQAGTKIMEKRTLARNCVRRNRLRSCRPQTAKHGPRRKPMEQRSDGGRASTVATAGNTSAKSSAGYGAFNLGERAMAPRVVTHPANACLEQS